MLKRFLLVVGILLTCTLASGQDESNESSEEDWVSMFNGKSLEGWTQKNGWASYRVEDETIVGRTAEGSPNSFLCTVKEYGDFELQFEVKVDSRLNSGVQIRSQTKETGPLDVFQTGRVNGPQVEIEASGNGGAQAGYVYGEAMGTSWLTAEERLKPHKRFLDDQWNHFRIVARGPRIETFINGELVEDLTDETAFSSHAKGFIGLQVHGIGSGAGPFEVAWRNLQIKEF